MGELRQQLWPLPEDGVSHLEQCGDLRLVGFGVQVTHQNPGSLGPLDPFDEFGYLGLSDGVRMGKVAEVGDESLDLLPTMLEECPDERAPDHVCFPKRHDARLPELEAREEGVSEAETGVSVDGVAGQAGAVVLEEVGEAGVEVPLVDFLHPDDVGRASL